MMKQSKTSYYLRILAALVIVFGGGYWLLQTQQEAAKKVFSVLPKFSGACIIAVVFLDCLQIFFMSLRFWVLYPKENRTSLKNVFSAMSIGQTMNSFLPARAGDFYKIASLTPKPLNPNFNMLTLTGILTADKLVDLSAFLILIFAFGSYKENTQSLNALNSLQWKWLLVFILLIGISWQLFLKNRFGKIARWLVQFIAGLKSLLAPEQLLLAILVGIFVWLTEAYVLVLLSSYQNFPLSLAQAFFVLTVLNLAIAVPISVANIGPFEASIAFALKNLGIPFEVALAIATVHHGLQVLGYVICGLLGWMLKRFSPSHS